MPRDGPGEHASPLRFTRRAIEANTSLVHRELHDARPHRFYRRLRHELDELRGKDAPYTVVAERSRDLEDETEATGVRTGAFTGRAQARAEVEALGPAQLSYRRWGPQGAFLLVLGFAVGLFGPLSGWLLLLAAVLGLAGLALFVHQAEAEVPLRRRDVLSVLLQGEACEQAQATPAGHRYELCADMEAVYAGEVFLRVDEEQVPELSWPLRAELSNRFERWQDPRSVDDDGGLATGFLDALRAWLQLDGEWTKREVEGVQRDIRASLTDRQAYTSLLDGLRASDVRQRELDRIEQELRALDGRMRAHVDAEVRKSNGHLAGRPSHRRIAVRRPTGRKAPLGPQPQPRLTPPPLRGDRRSPRGSWD